MPQNIFSCHPVCPRTKSSHGNKNAPNLIELQNDPQQCTRRLLKPHRPPKHNIQVWSPSYMWCNMYVMNPSHICPLASSIPKEWNSTWQLTLILLGLIILAFEIFSFISNKPMGLEPWTSLHSEIQLYLAQVGSQVWWGFPLHRLDFEEYANRKFLQILRTKGQSGVQLKEDWKSSR